MLERILFAACSQNAVTPLKPFEVFTFSGEDSGVGSGADSGVGSGAGSGVGSGAGSVAGSGIDTAGTTGF